jgi:hypothetical protein
MVYATGDGSLLSHLDAQAWMNACIASYGGNYRPMEEVLMPIVNEIEK